MAFQIAMGRERFRYQAYFYSLAFFFLPIGAFKTKNPRLMIPLVPFSFIMAFQYDMLYGNMYIRATLEADRLIKEEPERFFMPNENGMMTQQEYRAAVGVSESYQPRITLASTYGHLPYPTMIQNVLFFDSRPDPTDSLKEKPTA